MEKQVSEGSLHKWFKGSKSKDGKGGWVNVVTGGTCASDEPGEGTPKCVSSAKRASMTKAERLSAARRKKKADPNQQQKSDAAKPTYVSTDKKKMKETYQRSLTPLSEKAQKSWKGYKKKGYKKEEVEVFNEVMSPKKAKEIEDAGGIENYRKLNPPDPNRPPIKFNPKPPKREGLPKKEPVYGPGPGGHRSFPDNPDTPSRPSPGIPSKPDSAPSRPTGPSPDIPSKPDSAPSRPTGPSPGIPSKPDSAPSRPTRPSPDLPNRPDAPDKPRIKPVPMPEPNFRKGGIKAVPMPEPKFRKGGVKPVPMPQPKFLNREEIEIQESDKKGKGSGTKDACYRKVKSRYSVWPSAYASGALVKCRKVGAANWGNSSKKEAFSDWKSEFIWEDGDSSKKIEEASSPAWQRKEGKSESGGLNKKGVASYRAANPGSKLKTAVTTKPSSLKRGSKDAKRRKSFCSRMKGMKKKLTSAKTARDPDSRINKALRKWNC